MRRLELHELDAMRRQLRELKSEAALAAKLSTEPASMRLARIVEALIVVIDRLVEEGGR